MATDNTSIGPIDEPDISAEYYRERYGEWKEIGYMDDWGVTNTTEDKVRWDRANPDTCRHHVVVRAAGYPHAGLSLWGCVSCEKLVPSDIADKRNYEFDVDHNVYVHNPIRKER